MLFPGLTPLRDQKEWSQGKVFLAFLRLGSLVWRTCRRQLFPQLIDSEGREGVASRYSVPLSHSRIAKREHLNCSGRVPEPCCCSKAVWPHPLCSVPAGWWGQGETGKEQAQLLAALPFPCLPLPCSWEARTAI